MGLIEVKVDGFVALSYRSLYFFFSALQPIVSRWLTERKGWKIKIQGIFSLCSAVTLGHYTFTRCRWIETPNWKRLKRERGKHLSGLSHWFSVYLYSAEKAEHGKGKLYGEGQKFAFQWKRRKGEGWICKKRWRERWYVWEIPSFLFQTYPNGKEKSPSLKNNILPFLYANDN